jgi:prepilin-type processing-associated H-X9-DG protein
LVPGESNGHSYKRGTAWGIFGNINVSTTFADIRDGTANTIMTGELQRLTDGSFPATPSSSHDGWAVGGDATGFTTGNCFTKKATAGDWPLFQPLNNGQFASPGSDHANGANFGLADGSVKWISTGIDINIFSLLGSMNDGVSAMIPE